MYADFTQPVIDESSPLARLKDLHQVEEVTDKTYGPLKVGCEQVVETYFPGRSLIVRSGLIVGPGDSSDRLTYWVRRLAEGGRVLVPNTPIEKLQLIDVRDLCEWIVKMVEERAVGTYNATGPKEELTLGKFINECCRFARNPVDVVWVDEQFLIDHHCDNWNKLPLWLPSKSKMAGIFNIDCRKAQDTGLSFRPLSETIVDTLRWDDQRADRSMRVGLKLEEEKTLLHQFIKE